MMFAEIIQVELSSSFMFICVHLFSSVFTCVYRCSLVFICVHSYCHSRPVLKKAEKIEAI